MDNVALILKGVGFAILAWIGVQVATTHPDHLILTVEYYSLGYYLLFIMPMISLIWGINLLRKYIRRKFKQFQNKNLTEIKKRCDA